MGDKGDSIYADNGGSYRGKKIVLTASQAEMSVFGNDPFLAFLNTFPHKLFPRKYLRRWFTPVRKPDGTAKFAMYGLRKVESLLIEEFGEENVATVNYADLDKFIGPDTELIAVASMDPVGLAYVSTTYNSLIGFGGDALNASEFRRLMGHPAIKNSKAKKILGGAGVWQVNEAGLADHFGFDHIYHGEAEHSLVPTIKKILAGEKLPRDIQGEKPDPAEIPIIRNAACYGMIEITRGCGRMCKFCTPTMRKRHSVPLDIIMKEVEVNIKGGSDMIFLATEDMFLWNCKERFVPNKEALVKLFSSIADYPGVEYIQTSHASLAPIIYDYTILEELTPILMPKTRWGPLDSPRCNNKFITVEVGIETGSPRVMNKIMKGKALPFNVDHWPELVVQGIGNYNDFDWWPLCTLMTGIPDETEDDLIKTLELVDDLIGTKTFLTPLLFIPIEEALLADEKRASLEGLSELQWEFITKCWRHNIDIWADDKKWINPAIFAVFWSIARWKHGKTATKPVMKMAGFPEDLVGGFKPNRRKRKIGDFTIPVPEGVPPPEKWGFEPPGPRA